MSKVQSRWTRKSQSRGGAGESPPAEHGYWCDNQQSQCQDQYPTCGGGKVCSDCGRSYKRCKCKLQRGGEVPVGDYCDNQQTQCSDNFACATGGSDAGFRPRTPGFLAQPRSGGADHDETYRLYKQYKRLYKRAKRDVVLGASKVPY